jgi:lipid II:glycine glycyltransferase (peptidoglycan interpeptide bridge formation enzyme)
MGKVEVSRVGLDKLDPTWNPFQSQFWALAKRPSGWRAFAFSYTAEGADGSPTTSVMLVLVRRLFLGMRLAYVPFGPPVDIYADEPSTQLQVLSAALKPLMPKGTAFIRYDLPWFDDGPPPTVTGKGLKTCRESVQPEGTSRIDLTVGFEQVRSQYRERARRNIRKARAHGITVKRWDGSSATFEQWYQVYLETARRDGFTSRPSSYILHLLQMEKKDITTHLYLSHLGNKVNGGALVISSESVAVYLFGASLRVEGCSPSYLLQDVAIGESCERGCAIYDLYGISGPEGRGAHLDGLRLFKRAFGGYVGYRPPSVDFVYRRFIRFIYATIEDIRFKLHRRRHPKRMSQQYSVGHED